MVLPGPCDRVRCGIETQSVVAHHHDLVCKDTIELDHPLQALELTCGNARLLHGLL